MDNSDFKHLDSLALVLSRVRKGDVDAIGELFERYFARSVRLAQSKLSDGEARVIDEEEAAVSALDSLCIRVRGGAYEDIQDHIQLWGLLARIINRKLTKYRRHMYSRKRRPDRPLLPVDQVGESSSNVCVTPVAAREPSVAAIVNADEMLQTLLHHLADDDSRAVLLLRLEGHKEVEIADRLNHSRRWVHHRILSIQRVASSVLRDEL